ncbi:hypothetical protein ACFE04_001056 [Oxalis oulophora]
MAGVVRMMICVILAFTLVAAPLTEATITCGTVASGLAPCLTYLQGKVPLSSDCCKGISSLNNQAKSTPDRQAACECLKSLANSYKTINPTTAAGLPSKCGVNIPYKISTSTNCKSVK